MVLELSL